MSKLELLVFLLLSVGLTCLLNELPLLYSPDQSTGRQVPDFVQIRSDVAAALSSGRPVVALESTIITHGMPYPENVETALMVEATIREQGAIPATIAIINGTIRVGLDEDEIQSLAKSKNDVIKASRRDLAYIVSQKKNGALTVAGTMIVAEMVGIDVFVTGGIGGVHRGAETSFDVSADLTELGRTSVAVVCAGAKSILDIGLTLEFLETQGVTVASFQHDEFPAFFVRNSGFQTPIRVDTHREAAAIIETNRALNLGSGVVIACPVSLENALDSSFVAQKIEEALQEASDNNVSGKAITPFLLSYLEKITGGKTLAANIALIRNNARVGAAIARELAQLGAPK